MIAFDNFPVSFFAGFIVLVLSLLSKFGLWSFKAFFFPSYVNSVKDIFVMAILLPCFICFS